MRNWLAVGVGGALGSMARHGVNILVLHWLGRPPAYATAVVNIIGCAAIGAIAGWVVGGGRLTPLTQTFVMVGLLGGFTTFSTFGLDTFTLLHQGKATMALVNVAVQVVIGLAAVAAGFSLMHGR
jgi:CrcB protein